LTMLPDSVHRDPMINSSPRPTALKLLPFLALPFGLAAVLLASGSDLQAQDRSLSLERFDAEITVDPDGTIHVVETLDVRFEGSYQGVFRDLMTRHQTAEGRRARLRYDVDEATDRSGNPLRMEEEGISGGRRVRIWVPDARDAVRTVVLRYTVRGGLRFFDEGPEGRNHDELYWQVTGTGWDGPILAARARVRLPDGATGVEAWGYTGTAASGEQAVEVRATGDGAEIVAERSLEPGEGLTISVIWDPGLVDRPTAAARTANAFRDNWPFALPILAFLGMFRIWTLRGRDPVKRAIMVQYDPPDDLSPAEVGTLVDHKAELHDITSTLVDLAVRGYLTIEEKERTGILARLSRTKEFTFHQRRPRSTWDDLRPHERAYLGGLFSEPEEKDGVVVKSVGEAFSLVSQSFSAWRDARREGRAFDSEAFAQEWNRERSAERQAERGGGAVTAVADGEGNGKPDEPLQSVDLSDLQNEFYVHMDKIRKKIYARLKERGFYERRPDHAPVPWVILGVAVFIGGIFLTIAAVNVAWPWAPAPLPAVVATVLSAIIVLGFGARMGVRTEPGVRALEQILGFKEFLERVEAPQYARMITSPEMFEKYLPYAMALKVEERWARAFDGLYRQPPDWYSGASVSTGFQASAFARSMSSMSTQASSTMSSSPGGSSGSGGGGSVGGGSGGGGGGGF